MTSLKTGQKQQLITLIAPTMYKDKTLSKFLKEVSTVGAVTTNPWLIAVINMTIVFGVLIALGGLMSLIQVVEPTKKKA